MWLPQTVCCGEGMVTWHDLEKVVLFNKILKIKEQAATYQACYRKKKCFGTICWRSPRAGMAGPCRSLQPPPLTKRAARSLSLQQTRCWMRGCPGSARGLAAAQRLAQTRVLSLDWDETGLPCLRFLAWCFLYIPLVRPTQCAG